MLEFKSFSFPFCFITFVLHTIRNYTVSIRPSPSTLPIFSLLCTRYLNISSCEWLYKHSLGDQFTSLSGFCTIRPFLDCKITSFEYCKFSGSIVYGKIVWSYECTKYYCIKIWHLQYLRIIISMFSERAVVEKHMWRFYHTTKCRYDKFPTAKLPYGEFSLRRNFLTAKFPFSENSYRKIPHSKISYGEIS